MKVLLHFPSGSLFNFSASSSWTILTVNAVAEPEVVDIDHYDNVVFTPSLAQALDTDVIWTPELLPDMDRKEIECQDDTSEYDQVHAKRFPVDTGGDYDTDSEFE